VLGHPLIVNRFRVGEPERQNAVAGDAAVGSQPERVAWLWRAAFDRVAVESDDSQFVAFL